jgi:hypothetical protein
MANCMRNEKCANTPSVNKDRRHVSKCGICMLNFINITAGNNKLYSVYISITNTVVAELIILTLPI